MAIIPKSKLGLAELRIHVADLLKVLAGGYVIRPDAELPTEGLMIDGLGTDEGERGPLFCITVAHPDLPREDDVVITVDLSIEQVPQQASRGYHFL